MNNDVKDLMLAKKEKINEWLEYLNSEDDDVIWIQKNRVFSTGLYNIIYQLQKIESNDFIKKQEELVNTIGQHINNRDRLKVKEIVNKLKDLDDGKKINDDIDFNNLDQMISNIDNKLEQLKQEELKGKTPEEQEKINEQWNKEEKEFSNITNSIINSFKESKTNDVIQKNPNDNVSLSQDEYEMLKKFEEETLKIQRCDFALIVNSGAVLPTTHPNYNNGRIKIEIFDINNNNIEIDGKKYVIKTQVLFNKIKSFISDNLNVLVDWSKKETNFYLDNNAYEGGKSKNIKVKYGQLLIYVDGQVTGDLGKNVDEFINYLKELILKEIDKDDKDYMVETISNIHEQAKTEFDDGKLKVIIEEVIGGDDSYLNTSVYDIIKKIIELPNETTTTIAGLINYNPNEKFVEPLTQGQIRRFVKDTCKKLNIKLEENKDGFGGLAYYYQFKKINNDDEFEKYCKLYEEKFGKKAYIPEPSGTKEFVIECIKKCLQENKDILDELYYSKDDAIY